MCFANRSIIKNTDSDFKGCPTKCFCHLELSKQDIQKLFLFPTLIAAASQVLSHFNALNLRSVSALAPKAHPHRPNCTTSTLRITGNNSAFVQKTQGSFKARTVSTATSVLGEIAQWIFIKRPQHPAAQQLTSIWVTHDASMCVPVPIYMCVCVCLGGGTGEDGTKRLVRMSSSHQPFDVGVISVFITLTSAWRWDGRCRRWETQGRGGQAGGHLQLQTGRTVWAQKKKKKRSLRSERIWFQRKGDVCSSGSDFLKWTNTKQ